MKKETQNPNTKATAQEAILTQPDSNVAQEAGLDTGLDTQMDTQMDLADEDLASEDLEWTEMDANEADEQLEQAQESQAQESQAQELQARPQAKDGVRDLLDADSGSFLIKLSGCIKSLVMLLDQESELVRHGMIEAVGNMAARKTNEMNRYAEFFTVLKMRPDLLHDLGENERRKIISLSDEFDRAADANERAIRFAIKGTKEVVECFREASASRSNKFSTYGATGRVSKKSGASSVSVERDI